jgi:carbonic anhydrase/acetyltransferase-like protein (isoleucine patch superfamily)
MLIEHGGNRPRVDETAYVSPAAVLSGDVAVGPETRILHGAVLTSEGGPVEIGARCVVMENAVLRGTRRHPLRVEDDVLVGPRAYLSGCAVEQGAFLATGATVFNGATVGSGAEIRVNGTLHVNSSLSPNATVPIGWVALGDPAEILSPHDHDRIWAIQESLDFPGTVFGASRDTPMTDLMRRYTRALERHRDDQVVD